MCRLQVAADDEMQDIEVEVSLLRQLVRKVHVAPFRQKMHMASTLAEFCSSQPQEKGWKDACGRAGVVAALVQAVKICSADLKQEDLIKLARHADQFAALQEEVRMASNVILALAGLVDSHHDNQSAAAAAGAIHHLMQLTKSCNMALKQKAVIAIKAVVHNHLDNQSAAGAAGVVECMCNLLSFDILPIAFEAACALNNLTSLADNARRAVSMGAVALLLQLNARSGDHPSIDQVIAKLTQVPTAPPPMPSSEPAFAAAASAAPAPVPAPASRLAPGSRVRIEGLQGRPEMNGRTGVICGGCGALQRASMLCSC